jgi:hypothetical protein
MATLEKYDNLPGVKVTYEDGNLYAGNQRLQANTQSILIMGSAVDGPVGEPISVRDIGVKAAEKLFGGLVDRKTKEPHGGSLIRAMYEALREGNEDIRLLRIDGQAAKTELKAKDLARATEQFLDYADGNTAFAADLNVPAGGKFVGNVQVYEIDKVTGAEKVISGAVNYVDNSAGAEKVHLYANKMRPGNTVKLTYDYETRNYTLVPKAKPDGTPDYSDPDYTLTRDSQRNHYFYSARKNWSDKLESGHIPVVVVKDNVTGNVATISSTTPSGEYIYRVGKGQVANPLTDPWSEQDYKDGGIFFTAAYDAEVAKGTYPDINGNVTVMVEYAWYTAFANKGEVTTAIPGVDVDYELNYTPMSDEFKVYYTDGANKVFLTEGVDYGLSIVDKLVTIFAGVAPVGAQLFASYKTSSSTVTDPKLIVEGKYPGRVYGCLDDIFDKDSIRGVKVEVQVDDTDPTGLEKIIIFHKPEEKRLTSKDDRLIYRTKDLPKVRTLRQFVQHVNADPMNNVVTLSCANEHGSVALQGLLPTAPMFLGEEEPGKLKEDPTAPLDSEARYPWLGRDGFFDTTSEASMQDLFMKLGGVYEEDANGNIRQVKQGIYSKLENYAVDIIVLVDAYANTVIDYLEPAKNFATQLAQHCAVVTAKTWETIGVIGMAPALESSLLEVQEYVDIVTQAPASFNLSDERKQKYAQQGIRLDYTNIHNMYNEATFEEVLNEEGNPIDIGRYVQVVFGPEIGLSSDKLGNYVTSGATVYAALISKLNPEVATTNKSLESVFGMRYKLSQAQHNQLVGGRYVTFDSKLFGGNAGAGARFVVIDGVTAARPDSDYTRLSTLRITHASVQLIRQKADPFIGLPNGLAQRNALAAEIQAALDKLKERGVLQRFKFTIFSSTQDKVLGNAFITLELVPQFETRQFHTSVVLKAS